MTNQILQTRLSLQQGLVRNDFLYQVRIHTGKVGFLLVLFVTERYVHFFPSLL